MREVILRKGYVKAMIWNIDERFPLDVFEILNIFSMFDLEKVPTNPLSNEFLYLCL